MKSKQKIPEDLKVKIGSKEEAFWTELRDKLDEDNLNMFRQININLEIILFASKQIAEEKEKFK